MKQAVSVTVLLLTLSQILSTYYFGSASRVENQEGEVDGDWDLSVHDWELHAEQDLPVERDEVTFELLQKVQQLAEEIDGKYKIAAETIDFLLGNLDELDLHIEEIQDDRILLAVNETPSPTLSPAPSPTPSPSPNPTPSPSTSPIPNPPSPTPAPIPIGTESPEPSQEPPEEGINGIMVWGLVGFTLLGLALIVAFFGFYTTKNRNKAGNGDEIDNDWDMEGRKSPMQSLEVPRLSRARDSLSTVFSRDRFSTWSGRYSGKIEAAPGKDDALAGYMRDVRHEKNAKRKKRKDRNADNPGASRKGNMNSPANGRSTRQQQGTNLENASLREVGTEEDVGTDVEDNE